MAPEAIHTKIGSHPSINACYKNPSSTIDNVRANERISEMRDSVNGKIFSGSKVVKLMYPDKLCQKQEIQFDIGSQIITVGSNKFKLTLPQGAHITQVSFSEDKVKIDGKIGFFTGSGEASYKSLIQALDEVLQNGNATMVSSSGEITLTRYA